MNRGLLIVIVALAIILSLVVFVVIIRIIARITKGSGDGKSSSGAPPDGFNRYY